MLPRSLFLAYLTNTLRIIAFPDISGAFVIHILVHDNVQTVIDPPKMFGITSTN